MIRRIISPFCALVVAVSFAGLCVETEVAFAQRERGPSADADTGEHGDWYYDMNSPEKPEKSIAQQKAELRAQQRMDRLASMRWYGFTPGRPTAATMPFTSMYSPAWSRPGGRPFAWYTGYEPTVVITRPYSYRYR